MELIKHPTWKQAFDWVNTQGIALPDGDYEINGRDLYASIATPATAPRNETVYEAHQEYIDIHFCVTDGEIIEYASTETLVPKTEYDEEKDYQLFETPIEADKVILTPQSFVILFPGEGHMPKIQDGLHSSVHKIVVKVKKNLI